MNTITFTEEKKVYTIAGSFNELTRKQLIKLAGVINIKLNPVTKKHHIIRTLLNVGTNPFATFLFRFKLKPGHIVDMFPAVEFALKAPDLTKQLIPDIRIPYSFKKLYGPSDHMENLVFIEFIKCENNYTKFRKTGKIEYLDNLVAILYRPKVKGYQPDSPNFNGDIREKYNDFNVSSRAKQIKKLDIHTKLAVLTFYHGCRDFIINHSAFRLVFTKEEKNKVESSKATWEDVLIGLADHKTHYIDNVSETRLFTVLRLINDKIKRDQEQLEFIKKQKPR